jgi:YVTN family beta-propeller protein
MSTTRLCALLKTLPGRIASLIGLPLLFIGLMPSTTLTQVLDRSVIFYGPPGGSGNVRMLHTPQVSSAVTLEAWVYPMALPETDAVIIRRYTSDYSDPYYVYSLHLHRASPSGPVRAVFGISNGTPGSVKEVSSSDVIPLFQWTHLAGVYDGGNITLYVNGTAKDSLGASGLIPVAGEIRMGLAIAPATSSRFFGFVDEVRHWNIARSKTDVFGSMGGVDPLSPGLIGYWKFNEPNSATMALDESPSADSGQYRAGAHTELFNPSDSTGTSQLLLSPTSVDFGTLEAGESVSRQLTVSNTSGTQTLVGYFPSTGNVIVPLTAFVIPAGGDLSTLVYFTPVTAGPVNLTITPVSNATPPVDNLSVSGMALDEKKFDVNTIGTYLARNGRIGQTPESIHGFEWPQGSGKFPIFEGGLWLSGQVSGEIRTAAINYVSEFQAGPIIDGVPADPSNNKYRMYKISVGDNSTNPDFAEWPADLGAPVHSDGSPRVLGTQTLFAVYNDANPALHMQGNAFQTQPMGAEVQQTVYGYSSPDALSSTVFISFKIVNRGTLPWTGAHAAFWIDPDIGYHMNDFVGSDVDRNLGFVYNSTLDDSLYSPDPPPCAGTALLKGPNNAKPLTSFAYYYAGGDPALSDPANASQMYNFIQGLRRDGTPYLDGGSPTVYPLSGDPVTGTGSIDIGAGDRRMLVSSGPFDLGPGQSTELVVAVVLGVGRDNLTSITEVRSMVDAAQAYYQGTASEVKVPAGYVSDTYTEGLDKPIGMAIDANRHLIVVESGTGSIWRYLDATTRELVANGLSIPIDIVVSGNTLYVSDMGLGSILSVNLGGTLPATPTTVASGLDGPSFMQMGPDGNLYVSTPRGVAGDRVMQIALPLGPAATFVIFDASANAQPQGIVFAPTGEMYLSAQFLGKVPKVKWDVSTPLPIPGSSVWYALEGLDNPCGIALGSDDRLYVATRDNIVVSRRDSRAWYPFLTGLTGGYYNNIEYAGNGEFYVADYEAGRIIRVALPMTQKVPGSSFPIKYKMNIDGHPVISDGSEFTAIQNSFQMWENIPTCTASFVDSGFTAARYASMTDGVNLVTFTDDQFPFPPGVLAIAAKTILLAPGSQEATIVDADVVFNPYWNNQPKYNFGTDTYPGLFDIQSIATHEIGHILGLLHSGVANATMFFVLQAGTATRTLEADDIAWASSNYPEAGYEASTGKITGTIRDGYDISKTVAGALVLATNTGTNVSYHSYSDENGNYVVAGLPPGTYRVSVQPLDGDVSGYPMTAANVSAYLYAITSFTDYPFEYYNQNDVAVEDTMLASTVTVSAGITAPGTDVITNNDVVRPAVAGVYPAAGTTNVGLFSQVIVTFTEPIDTNTVNPATLSVSSISGPVSGLMTYVKNNSAALFTPDRPLDGSRAYTISATTGIADVHGNPLQSPFSSTFTTTTPDITPPMVVQTMPQADSIGVFVTSPVIIRFSERMDPASITDASVTLSCPECSTGVQGTIALTDQNMLATFTPTRLLAEGTTYTVHVTQDVKDASGNALAALFQISFTTVTNLPPSVVTTGPANGSVGVSVTTPIYVDFSEPIDTATVTAQSISLEAAGVAVSGSFTFLNQDSRVVFRPDTSLQYKTSHSILISTTITDLSGTPLQASSQAYFETEAQLQQPVLMSIDPPSGVVGTVVVIGGNGFDPDPSKNVVTFNGTPAVISQASLTSVTAIVPQDAQSGLVFVVVRGIASTSKAFAVLSPLLNSQDIVTANTPTQSQPKTPVVTPDGVYAYVTNSGSNTVTVLDLSPSTPSSVATIPVGKVPLYIAINAQGTLAYVTNYASNTVSVIDIDGDQTNKIDPNTVIATVAVGMNPMGVAITKDGRRVYVANSGSNTLSVIDGDPQSGAFDHVVANPPTPSAPKTVAVSPDGALAFVAAAGGVLILDLNPSSATYNNVIAQTSTPSQPKNVTVSPDGAFAIVTTDGGGIVLISAYPNSPSFGQIIANVSTPSKPGPVTPSPDGIKFYVTNAEDNSVYVFELAYGAGVIPGTPTGITTTSVTMKFVKSIRVGSAPEGIVIDPAYERVLVANTGSNSLSVIRVYGFDNEPVQKLGDLVGLIQNCIDDPATSSVADSYLKKAQKSIRSASDKITKGDIVHSFDDLRQAIQQLKLAAKAGATVGELIAPIVQVADKMAQDALTAAQDFSGLKKVNNQISTATFELKTARSLVSKKDEENAMTHYKTAWDAADRAVKLAAELIHSDGQEPQPTIAEVVPTDFSLGQNYPNPFNPSTQVTFDIPAAPGDVHVELLVYNMLGQVVNTLVNEMKSPGRYLLEWNGKDQGGRTVATGVYILSFRAGAFHQARKILLLR